MNEGLIIKACPTCGQTTTVVHTCARPVAGFTPNPEPEVQS